MHARIRRHISLIIKIIASNLLLMGDMLLLGSLAGHIPLRHAFSVYFNTMHKLWRVQRHFNVSQGVRINRLKHMAVALITNNN